LEYSKNLGVTEEDVIMRLFAQPLTLDARDWYKALAVLTTSIFIFRKITQTYLSLLAQQRLLLNYSEKLLDFCPRNPYTIWLYQQ
jgi:hypothetical protein